MAPTLLVLKSICLANVNLFLMCRPVCAWICVSVCELNKCVCVLRKREFVITTLPVLFYCYHFCLPTRKKGSSMNLSCYTLLGKWTEKNEIRMKKAAHSLTFHVQFRGFLTKMVYLDHITCLRYTILVRNYGFVRVQLM